MICGIGTDIVAVERMRERLERRGDVFAERLLAEEELPDYRAINGASSPILLQRQAAFLAKRFAVKEAAAKAMGTGFAEGLGWRQIYVTHDARGKPMLVMKEAALERAHEIGASHWHVTLADEQQHAVAFVVLEQ